MFHSDTHIDLYQPTRQDDGQGFAVTITRTQVMASLAVSMGSMIVGIFVQLGHHQP